VTTLVLIGPMGSGKTTYGRKLAKRLGLRFVDTDKTIAQHHGPITEIFARHGEEHFRDLETAALQAALTAGGVIATGGGVVLRDENLELIRGHAVIYLETSAGHTANRLDSSRRPLLAGGPDRWSEIFESRRERYETAATARVFTGGKPIGKVMDELEKLVQELV
jgi:shikimate kinase